MRINGTLLKCRVKHICHFEYFTEKKLWYRNIYDDFMFPIPLEETINEQGGDPIFNAEEKGIFLMRWIRKEMERELKEEADASQV